MERRRVELVGKRYFKGDTPELNAVLGLINKRLEQGVTFESSNYVLKNFRKAEEIVGIITDMNDPVTNFECKHMPDDLTEKEEESKIKMKMWKMRVKRYMDREEILIDNTNKLHGIVIGQCTPPLRSTIKGDAEYEKKSSDFDTLWLLQKNKEDKRSCGHEVESSFDFA